MADEEVKPGGGKGAVKASDHVITLSQAVLAPLDAIFEAQIHSARSFLNMILQLGYPHSPPAAAGDEAEQGDGDAPAEDPTSHSAFMVHFHHETDVDGDRVLQRVAVPALSLVPVAPLAVKEADFEMEMAVRGVAPRRQHQDGRKDDDEGEDSHRRPWFLVDQPVTLCGSIAPPEEKGGVLRTRRGEATVKIRIKVASIPTPAGLDRLLSSIGHMTQYDRIGEEPTEPTDPEDDSERV